MASTFSLDDATLQRIERRRIRLERLLQIAAHDYDLRLEFGSRDQLGEATIVMGIDPEKVFGGDPLALKGEALHLLGHYLSESLIWADTARRQEAQSQPYFASLWHALEDARLENWLLRRWPGARRAFEAKIPPNLGGSLFTLLSPTHQVEMGLYLEGRGYPGAPYKPSVQAALDPLADSIRQGANGDTPRASLEAMTTIYPAVAMLLRAEHLRRSPRPSEPERYEQREDEESPDGESHSGRTPRGGAPEIELHDDELVAVGVAGRRHEFPDWYRPGTAPWFERDLGRKEVHPTAVRADRQTIVRPPHGDPEDYRRLRSEIQREVGYLARRLTNLLREEVYLRYGGYYASGKLNMAKLWKQRLGNYRLFQRPLERGKRGEAFTLLIDESASMKGQDKWKVATKAALLLGETLDQLGVPLEIIGYTTADFEARAAMQLGLTPAHEYRTTRCSPLEHRIYKHFGEPYRVVHTRLTGIEPRHNNWDEEHLRFAFRRIQARPEHSKVIIVISDGQPNGDANYLIETVARLESLGIKLVGVGIGGDFVRQIYRHAVVVSDFRQLAEELFQILARQLRNGPPSVLRGPQPGHPANAGVALW